MESLLFTELTLSEQENLCGGRHKKQKSKIQQSNVSKVKQQATAKATAIGPNSTAAATASNYAIVIQGNLID